MWICSLESASEIAPDAVRIAEIFLFSFSSTFIFLILGWVGSASVGLFDRLLIISAAAPETEPGGLLGLP